ncbi:MAG: hypothetical protein ACLPN1_06195 [Dissulfurispiraceae bacterium]|jgi:hypothetical protein
MFPTKLASKRGTQTYVLIITKKIVGVVKVMNFVELGFFIPRGAYGKYFYVIISCNAP